jgi:hypothetical protein
VHVSVVIELAGVVKGPVTMASDAKFLVVQSAAGVRRAASTSASAVPDVVAGSGLMSDVGRVVCSWKWGDGQHRYQSHRC